MTDLPEHVKAVQESLRASGLALFRVRSELQAARRRLAAKLPEKPEPEDVGVMILRTIDLALVELQDARTSIERDAKAGAYKFREQQRTRARRKAGNRAVLASAQGSAAL